MPLPPDIYDRDYFLSDRCEGFEYFQEGALSLVKQYEMSQLRVQPGQRVLDAGCGRGEVLKAFADAGAQVAGLDYSEAAVQISRETLASVEGADIRHGDVTDLPWPDASFDRVLFGDVIEHLDPSQALVALREFRRVLKPGGTLLVHTAPNRWFRKISWPVMRPVMKVVARDAAAKLDHYLDDVLTYHANELSLPALRKLVRAAGFPTVEAWIAPDVLRSGSHRLTQGLDESRLFRLAARVAATRPVRLFLGNDLYARATRA